MQERYNYSIKNEKRIRIGVKHKAVNVLKIQCYDSPHAILIWLNGPFKEQELEYYFSSGVPAYLMDVLKDWKIGNPIQNKFIHEPRELDLNQIEQSVTID